MLITLASTLIPHTINVDRFEFVEISILHPLVKRDAFVRRRLTVNADSIVCNGCWFHDNELRRADHDQQEQVEDLAPTQRVQLDVSRRCLEMIRPPSYPSVSPKM
jgi:hypothetical protein